MSQASQSDCQCFDSSVFRLHGQGALLGTRLPVLMEIITLRCWRFVFIGGRFASRASSRLHTTCFSLFTSFGCPTQQAPQRFYNHSHPFSYLIIRPSSMLPDMSLKTFFSFLAVIPLLWLVPLGIQLIPGGQYKHSAWLRNASDTFGSLGTDPWTAAVNLCP